LKNKLKTKALLKKKPYQDEDIRKQKNKIVCINMADLSSFFIKDNVTHSFRSFPDSFWKKLIPFQWGKALASLC